MKILSTNGMNLELKEKLAENNVQLLGIKDKKQKCDITIVEYSKHDDFLNWITSLKVSLEKTIVIAEDVDDTIIYKASKLGVIDIIKKSNNVDILSKRIMSVVKEVQFSAKSKKS